MMIAASSAIIISMVIMMMKEDIEDTHCTICKKIYRVALLVY